MSAIKRDVEAPWMTLGRNGYSQAFGIEISDFTDAVLLEPINSKGDIGRARLVVPKTHIHALRDVLNNIIADHEASSAA